MRRTGGGVLVIRGEPGIGKSAVLGSARGLAVDHEMRVLTATGVESEANLSYAGLHQLLQPLLTGVPQLPPRLRSALLAAFRIQDGQVADRFLTALAALELLADAAHLQPLAVLVDDTQWLDTPTVDALGFIARRIASEPIVMLMAVRGGQSTVLAAAHLPHLDLMPLDADSCSAPLDRHSPTLESRTRSRILAAAAGNPLALVELPLAAPAVAGDRRLADDLPLTERLQMAFSARFADLPAASRLVLLVTAANGTVLWQKHCWRRPGSPDSPSRPRPSNRPSPPAWSGWT